MMMLTKENLRNLPVMYTNENKSPEEIKVPVKFFNPCGSGTWYATEYDPSNGQMFGYVTGLGFDELGDFNLNELKEVRLPFGLKIERDRYWDANNTLAQVMNGEKS